ncbi:NAD(P)H-binding protein [Kribbella albertanoniae]|uniref:NAD-dependent epimerase/dehydratase family protein n=1 Tax=Kribbella albertanoniae TaxID=1266829 RepID=A0A4R4P1A6_9ACTN|nr:NAD(P)H-binding protein [Kribbella albertanoniae]TDC15314.1 NAD-dependent epimerase/dehydratase family protein [Kribbella albertanoniae]
MILVTGATGNVGAELVRTLAAEGRPVRGLVRAAGARLPDGAEPVLGDLNEPTSLRTALDGADAMFLLAGYPSEVLVEAAAAGVQRVVLLSGGSAIGADTDNVVSQYMIKSESDIRASGLEWTILRPTAFMSNTLEWVPQLRAGDVVRAPFADIAVATIDPFDIAAVAAAALAGGHAGREYQLSGPESLLPAERVQQLGQVLDRPLRFEAESNDEAWIRMTAAMPEPYVRAFFSFYVDKSLDESAVLNTVDELTGRAPRTFQHWARAHRSDFR